MGYTFKLAEKSEKTYITDPRVKYRVECVRAVRIILGVSWSDAKHLLDSNYPTMDDTPGVVELSTFLRAYLNQK